MTTAFRIGSLLFVGVAIGFVAGGGSINSAANGQAVGGNGEFDSVPPEPRFQMATWATSTAPSSQHGCYILDTITGELWNVNGGEAPIRLADEMPKATAKKDQRKAK